MKNTHKIFLTLSFLSYFCIKTAGNELSIFYGAEVQPPTQHFLQFGDHNGQWIATPAQQNNFLHRCFVMSCITNITLNGSIVLGQENVRPGATVVNPLIFIARLQNLINQSTG